MTTIELWRTDRHTAEKRLQELWDKGNHDQPLYLVYFDLGDAEYAYHIITKSEFESNVYHDAKFVKSVGENAS